MSRVFHPVANTSEAHLRYVIGPKACENVYAYHWAGSVAPSSTQLLQLATELWSAIIPKYQNMLSTRVYFTECYARNVNTEFANEATYVPTTFPYGGRGNTPAASNVAYNLTKRTGLTGRSHHGAVHLSGFSDSDITADTILSYLLAQFISITLSILADRVAGLFVPALASRKLATSIPLTSLWLPSLYVDSSKKRLADS